MDEFPFPSSIFETKVSSDLPGLLQRPSDDTYAPDEDAYDLFKDEYHDASLEESMETSEVNYNSSPIMPTLFPEFWELTQRENFCRGEWVISFNSLLRSISVVQKQLPLLRYIIYHPTTFVAKTPVQVS
jgi:hypothetical protein